MDWAKDYRGTVVRAQRGVYFGYVMSCPTCGEPVHFRQGAMRRPHFAHYSHRAKPDCELYHPPSGVLNRVKSQAASKAESLYPRRDSLLCGLFLSYRQELSTFELSVRIPSLPFSTEQTGSLWIQHKTGLKEFTIAQLSKVHTLTVTPEVPLLECGAERDLLPLSDHINEQTSLFSANMNLFSVSEGRGRMLFENEPLEWGGKYWIVSADSILPPENILAYIECTLRGALANWKVYEVELPSTFNASKFNSVKEGISAFFNRAIRGRRPRACIVHPLPHHIGVDGAYIYPDSPGVLVVQITPSHEISVEGAAESIGNARFRIVTDERVQIEGLRLKDQDITILIDGIEQVVVRVEECCLIQPNGIELTSEDLLWNLVSYVDIKQTDLYAREIRVICSNDRLARYVEEVNEGLQFDGLIGTMPENSEKTVLAEGFGEIRPARSKTDDNLLLVTENQKIGSNMEKWVLNVIRSRYDSRTASMASNFISNPVQSNFQQLGSLLASPLMAYILASSKYKRPNRNYGNGIQRNK